MTFNRRAAFSAAAFLAVSATLVFAATAPTPARAAADSGAPFCLARGGVNGENSYVGNCTYFDYQRCLQAAAESRANCVQNIDYHGAPPAPRGRRR